MLRSLYNAAAALNVLGKQHEQISNNLANVNTSGYRRTHLSVAERSGSHRANSHFGFGPEIEKRNIDFSQGRIVETGRSLDVAIAGDAFFEIESPEGDRLLTKNGRFYRDPSSGALRTDSNLKVLGENGPITIEPSVADSEISIGPDGTISAGSTEVGKLKIVAFENTNTLKTVGQAIFRRSAASVERDPVARIRQKAQEISNVNPTSELIALIVGGRQYEAIQKATRSISETLEQSIRA